MQYLWNTFLYEPLHNALIFLIGIVPGGDVGVAVILLTIIVKLILFPLSQKSVRSQIAMKMIEPDIAKIKEQYKDDKQEQAKKTFELYKEKKVNPFSGCVVLLIQLPIIFALYYVFLHGLDVAGAKMYSFIQAPDVVNTNFLGILDVTGKSLVLAVLTGLSQFFQMKLSVPPVSATPATGEKSFMTDFSKSMNFQMKYILPIFIAFVSYSISAAVALYWFTSNLFAIGQELYVRNKVKKEGI